MSNPHLRMIRSDEELRVADLTGGVGDWRERALCREVDGELFYPDKGESNREAKRMCGRCEVKTECLEYALDADERWGVWGGLSERERRAMKKKAAA